jgi:hypothetical protein
MKREEQIASAFLKAYFAKEPTYEPVGKSVPPDFCINRTAFEIRRLNQQFVREDGSAEGLEQVEYKLKKAVQGELGKIPFSPFVGSFFWGVDFERPLGARAGRIGKEIAKEAISHYSNGPRVTKIIRSHGVAVTLIPASNPYSKAFVSGFDMDGDSGGMVSEIYLESIHLALEEKITKTKNAPVPL